MNETTRWILAAVILFFVCLAIGIWQGVIIWEECREAGHSVLYCMRMVMR